MLSLIFRIKIFEKIFQYCQQKEIKAITENIDKIYTLIKKLIFTNIFKKIQSYHVTKQEKNNINNNIEEEIKEEIHEEIKEEIYEEKNKEVQEKEINEIKNQNEDYKKLLKKLKLIPENNDQKPNKSVYHRRFQTYMSVC